MSNSFPGDPASNMLPDDWSLDTPSTPPSDQNPDNPRFAHGLSDGANIQKTSGFWNAVLQNTAIRSTGNICPNTLPQAYRRPRSTIFNVISNNNRHHKRDLLRRWGVIVKKRRRTFIVEKLVDIVEGDKERPEVYKENSARPATFVPTKPPCFLNTLCFQDDADKSVCDDNGSTDKVSLTGWDENLAGGGWMTRT